MRAAGARSPHTLPPPRVPPSLRLFTGRESREVNVPMTPTVSRLLRWAAVLGAGILLTLAVWPDPVLAALTRW